MKREPSPQCPAGHQWTPENTAYHLAGRLYPGRYFRRCRACARQAKGQTFERDVVFFENMEALGSRP